MTPVPLEIEGLPANAPRPVGPRVLVEVLKAEKRKTGGLIELPDEVLDSKQYLNPVVKVVAFSPDAFADKTRFPSGPICNLGDHVSVNPYSGERVEIKAHPQATEKTIYRVLFADEIKAVIPDPQAVAVYYE